MSIKVKLGPNETPTVFESESEAINLLLLRRRIKATVEQATGIRVPAATFLNANIQKLDESKLASAKRFIDASKLVGSYSLESDFTWCIPEQSDLTWRVVEKLAKEDTYEKKVFTVMCDGVVFAAFSTPEILQAVASSAPEPRQPAPKARPINKIITNKTKRSLMLTFCGAIFLSLLFLPWIITAVAIGVFVAATFLVPGTQACKCSKCAGEVDYEDTSCRHCSSVFEGTEREQS